jgi:hypothetical protein
VARIRSIKPEFFTSETLARVSKVARMTFIGLWTYVDDNGVGIDNERLIAAALYPLEPDFSETLNAVAEDLKQLESVGVVVRYEIAGRRYLFVRSWDEHQKVGHPGKPRYPRPVPGMPPHMSSKKLDAHERFAQSSGDPHEGLMKIDGDPHEGLTPEGLKGAGLKGAGNNYCPPPPAVSELDAAFAKFWDSYPRKLAKPKARKAFEDAIKKRKADPAAIVDAAALFGDHCRRTNKDPQFVPYPASWLNAERYNDAPEETQLRLVAGGHQPFQNPKDNSGYHEDF